MSTTTVYIFPDKFAFDEDISLKVFLRENTDSSIDLNAQNLRKIDSLLVQYLIAAAKAWQAKNLNLHLSQVPPALGDDLVRLGVEPQTLNWKVAA